MQPVSIEVYIIRVPQKYADLEGAVFTTGVWKIFVLSGQVKSVQADLVECIFCKILRLTIVLIALSLLGRTRRV